jgi:hypothetical protein
MPATEKSTRSNVRAVFQLEGYEPENKTIQPLNSGSNGLHEKALPKKLIIITSTRGTRTM